MGVRLFVHGVGSEGNFDDRGRNREDCDYPDNRVLEFPVGMLYPVGVNAGRENFGITDHHDQLAVEPGCLLAATYCVSVTLAKSSSRGNVPTVH